MPFYVCWPFSVSLHWHGNSDDIPESALICNPAIGVRGRKKLQQQQPGCIYGNQRSYMLHEITHNARDEVVQYERKKTEERKSKLVCNESEQSRRSNTVVIAYDIYFRKHCSGIVHAYTHTHTHATNSI